MGLFSLMEWTMSNHRAIGVQLGNKSAMSSYINCSSSLSNLQVSFDLNCTNGALSASSLTNEHLDRVEEK